MQQPQYVLKLDTPSANRLILNNLGIPQPPQQNSGPPSSPYYTPSFPSSTFYQSAFRPIHPDQPHLASVSTSTPFSSLHHPQQPIVPQTSNAHFTSTPISPPIIPATHQPVNTSKPTTSMKIPTTVDLYNNAPHTLKNTKSGLELKHSWKAHAKSVVSVSYNSTRNHFISITEDEMYVWEEPGKVLSKINFPIELSTFDLNPWSETMIVGGASKHRSTISFSRLGIKDGQWSILETVQKNKCKRVKGITALYEDEMIFGDNYFVAGEVEVESNMGFVCQYNGENNHFRTPVHSWNVEATPHALRKYTNCENLFFVATLACTMLMFDTRSPTTALGFGTEHLRKKSVKSVVHAMRTVPNGLYTAGTDNCLSFYDVRKAGEPIQSTQFHDKLLSFGIRNERFAVVSTLKHLHAMDLQESDQNKNVRQLADTKNAKYDYIMFHPREYLLFCCNNVLQEERIDTYAYDFEAVFSQK